MIRSNTDSWKSQIPQTHLVSPSDSSYFYIFFEAVWSYIIFSSNNQSSIREKENVHLLRNFIDWCSSHLQILNFNEVLYTAVVILQTNKPYLSLSLCTNNLWRGSPAFLSLVASKRDTPSPVPLYCSLVQCTWRQLWVSTYAKSICR